jgi:hypothetical protein
MVNGRLGHAMLERKVKPSVLYVSMQVVQQVHDLKLGRMVTRVVLPRVIMHSRQHYGVPTQALLKSTFAHFRICLPKCYCGADTIYWQ